jgi:hypothetical protein
MPPVRRRRTTLLALAAGLLLVVVVGLAWLAADDPDATGGVAAGAPTTAAEPAAGPANRGPTTAPEGSTGNGSPAGAAATSAGSGAPGPPAGPCQRIVSDAEAAAALGAAVARVEARDGSLVRLCTFRSSSDRYLLVQVQRGVATARDQFELSRLAADRPVAGIGQAARWTPDTGLLDVLVDGGRFQVGLFTPSGAPASARLPDRLEAVARVIAARL